MGIGDTVAGLSGNIEKAIIEIVDMRATDIQLETPVSVQASNTFAGVSGLKMAVDDVMPAKITEDRTVAMRTAAMNALNGQVPKLSGATTKRFVVQFNPSELSFNGFGGGLVSKSNFASGAQGSGISFEAMKVRINMNVKLIFDQVDPHDAFLQDKLSFSPTSTTLGLVKAGMTLAGKKTGVTVQNQVEGFIAALRSRYTRVITFHWGKLNYPGILNRVSSQYTMFNTLGQPIRGTVNLSLVCADEEISGSSMGIWQEKFEEAFGASALGKSYVKTSQRMGSLLNFNL